MPAASSIIYLPVAAIRVMPEDYPLTVRPGNLPRSGAFRDLVKSVEKNGVVVPVVVTKTNKLIEGHYRFWAAVAAGLDRVPVEVG